MGFTGYFSRKKLEQPQPASPVDSNGGGAEIASLPGLLRHGNTHPPILGVPSASLEDVDALRTHMGSMVFMKLWLQ